MLELMIKFNSYYIIFEVRICQFIQPKFVREYFRILLTIINFNRRETIHLQTNT